MQGWRDTYGGLISPRLLDSLDRQRIAVRWTHIISIGELAVLVAVAAGDTVAGFVSGGLPSVPVDGFDCELHKLYIRKGIQRRGIGTMLLRALAARLYESGFRSIAGHVLPGTAACVFLSRLGAELIREAEIAIDGETYLDAVYGWRELGVLLR